jgi:hypothetical protein
MPVWCGWVFSTPYFTVLTVNLSIHLEPCFICKKNNYRITMLLVANTTEARQQTCANDLANVGIVQCSGGAASVISVSVFKDV